MSKYTDDQLTGLMIRLEKCYYADLKFDQLQRFIILNTLPISKSKLSTKLAVIHMSDFFVNLSELFRFFRDDDELNDRLKTTNEARKEFRRNIRDVNAKSHDFDEQRKKVKPYVDSMDLSIWHQEFMIVFEYFRELLMEKDAKAGQIRFAESFRNIQTFIIANPPNFNYSDPDIEKDLMS